MSLFEKQTKHSEFLYFTSASLTNGQIVRLNSRSGAVNIGGLGNGETFVIKNNRVSKNSMIIYRTSICLPDTVTAAVITVVDGQFTGKIFSTGGAGTVTANTVFFFEVINPAI